jgi:hypothetical protein
MAKQNGTLRRKLVPTANVPESLTETDWLGLTDYESLTVIPLSDADNGFIL